MFRFKNVFLWFFLLSFVHMAYATNGISLTIPSPEDVSLVSIAISGSSSIDYGSSATYTCTATWSDGSTSKVTPKWSLSSTDYASVDTSGRVTNKNTTTVDRKPSLTANYTYAGIACKAVKSVTLLKSPGRALSSITISGPSSINYGSTATYTCTASWSDGTTSQVTPKWSLSSTDYASVDTSGRMTNKNTTTVDRKPTLTATYTFSGVTCKATKTVTLLKSSGQVLTSISISGPSSIACGDTATYTCTAYWSDGSTSQVSAKWSLSSTDYASVDTTTGKVTNRNTSTVDKKPTLTATCTSEGVTCKATKSVTLLKSSGRILMSLAISGASSIAYGGSATYTCTASWSDGSTAQVMPKWSLSSTDYASVDTSGKVTNKNTTTVDRKPSLTASYTSEGVTKTVSRSVTLLASGRILTSIAINGASSIAYGKTATYTCTATWSDGSTAQVTPKWSLSSTDYASVDTNGKVTNKNTTTVDRKPTLTASYTSGGVTKTASKSVTLLTSSRALTSIAISGTASIPSGGTTTLTCIATWSDGSTSQVTPKWTLSSTAYASIDSNGKLTNKNTTNLDQIVTLTASYTYGSVTRSASKSFTLAKGGPSLMSISISGASSIAYGGTSYYTCTATWSDGSTGPVTPKWSLSSTDYASVDTNGKVTNKNTTTVDRKPSLKASYTWGSVTCTAAKSVTLLKSSGGSRTLTSVLISGASSIEYGGTATYTCTATWSDGTTSQVTAKWSLSSTDYASVDSTTGRVTNKNTTTVDRKPSLTASYTSGGVTKTAAKSITLEKAGRSLTSIAISGASSIAYGGSATYTCTATWSDGTTSQVTAKWSLSSTDYASVDSSGKMTNLNTTMVDRTPTLKASYTYGGLTCTAAKSVTLLKSSSGRTLKSVSISGVSSIAYGATAAYTCTAAWSDGTTSQVTPKWSLSSTDYASVDTAGKVTNKNTSGVDKTPTLTASYTSGSVTKTASKSVTLLKPASGRTLSSISISGASSIAYGGTATYTCTATWSDGTTSQVTPKWSLSSTDYASVDTNGKVTNMNATTVDRKPTLTANYTSGGITCKATKSVTLLKPTSRSLTSISISGVASVIYGGTATYTCTATWNDGSTETVTPSWSLSSTAYASLSSGKITNKNMSGVNQTVTLNASYTWGSTTRTASKSITLPKANRNLSSISISGDSSIANGCTSSYTCTASWSDGSTSQVAAKWSLSSTDYASVDSNGKVTNKNMTTVDRTPTLKASYTFGGITCTASKSVKLLKPGRTLVSISIVGSSSIPAGGSSIYTCTAKWSDGETSQVTPKWSLSSTDYASVDSSGRMTNKNTTTVDRTPTLKASYTYGGITCTAAKSVKLIH